MVESADIEKRFGVKKVTTGNLLDFDLFKVGISAYKVMYKSYKSQQKCERCLYDAFTSFHGQNSLSQVALKKLDCSILVLSTICSLYDMKGV